LRERDRPFAGVLALFRDTVRPRPFATDFTLIVDRPRLADLPRGFDGERLGVRPLPRPFAFIILASSSIIVEFFWVSNFTLDMDLARLFDRTLRGAIAT
jgi:hypothetical protein